MAENVKCKSCKRLKKHWCKAVLDSPDEDMLRDCRHFLQKTNADRIRAMSDEELFVAIQKTYIGKAPWCDHHCKLDDDCSCSNCLKEWLQQPAEVDNG